MYKGISYQLRYKQINEEYDKYSKSGLNNRQIWKRYIYPKFGISERTFYNALKNDND